MRVTAALGLAIAVSGATVPLPARRERPRALEVRIVGFTFVPDTVAATPGDTIVWRNDDIVPHSIVLERPAVASPQLSPGAAFRLVVPDTGVRHYHCGLHLVMRGVVIGR